MVENPSLAQMEPMRAKIPSETGVPSVLVAPEPCLGQQRFEI